MSERKQPTADTRPDISSAMIARYPGTCTACDGPITPGQGIEADGREWQHDVCPPSRLDLTARDVVCETCWLVKPCDCDS